MSSKTVPENSSCKSSTSIDSNLESNKSPSSSINSKVPPIENNDTRIAMKSEKEQVSIFQLANDIEKALTELQTELSRNEKDFLDTISKIEKQLSEQITK
ncbi:Bil1p PWA37_001421 [Arxiozyma heterogenica]|uniref:Uncharacterized protein n=1 Tax=Arxiozyma heterogenica TaxID=278026 RepID=A0AAN7WP28_9SACH|nr:hypothetical protein RI543_002736 [Kazachstania heterogenica]